MRDGDTRLALSPTQPGDLASVISGELPFRIKALTGKVGDRVIGVGGIGFMPDGTIAAFAQLTPEVRYYPVSLHKAGVRLMQEVRRAGIRKVVALADPKKPAAERWLLRLGFREQQFEERKIFVWANDPLSLARTGKAGRGR